MSPVLDLPFRAWTLNDLGMVRQLTGDYPAAAASLQQALEIFRDIADRDGQACVLSNLGALHTATGTTRPPPPASARHLNYSATSAGATARPRRSTTWANC
jgi:hypothetical protein